MLPGASSQTSRRIGISFICHPELGLAPDPIVRRDLLRSTLALERPRVGKVQSLGRWNAFRIRRSVSESNYKCAVSLLDREAKESGWPSNWASWPIIATG